MDKAEYEKLAAREQVHWWHVSRRRILATALENLHLPDTARILEVGSGTGGNLRMLSNFGQLDAMEADGDARAIAAQATGVPIARGALPTDIPYPERTFDVVAAFDVIEHIDDDQHSVRALYSVTKPGGWFVSTVPAYGWMWSEHDELLHHKRRYTLGPYTSMIEAAGFRVRKGSYFNTFLFPLAAGVRLAQEILGKSANAERTVPRRTVNKILAAIFSAEAPLLRTLSFPFGMSILVIAQRPYDG